jgi:hypothetical protein
MVQTKFDLNQTVKIITGHWKNKTGKITQIIISDIGTRYAINLPGYYDLVFHETEITSIVN